MIKKKTITLISFFIFLLGNIVIAQVKDPKSSIDIDTLHKYNISKKDSLKKNLKVGLVLSGGGTKATSIIGVLKVIEKSGLRVDYISGTSMGAVIGAMYASGYNPRQIDSIFKSIKSTNVFNYKIPRRVKQFIEKRNEDTYGLTLPIEDFRIRLPKGFQKNQFLYGKMVHIFKHVSHVNDFSKLPIPFVCVATDLENGKSVFLNKGYLPQALIASSAFPLIFEPIEIDNKTFIDGGMSNNFPVEALKEKNMDIIIGIDIQQKLNNKNDIKSGEDIISQISSFNDSKELSKKKKDIDIYISPNVNKMGMFSFENYNKIIDFGEQSAMAYLPQLEYYASKQTNKVVRKKVSPQNTFNVDRISINKNKNYSKKYILEKLRLKENTNTTFEKLQTSIETVVATNNFSSFYHQFIVTDNDKKELKINLTPNKRHLLFKLSGNYNKLYGTSILLNLSYKRLITKHDLIYIDLILGDNFRYEFEYYSDSNKPWGFFIHNRYFTFTNLLSLEPSNENLLVSYVNFNLKDFTTKIYLQSVYKELASVGMGVEQKYISLEHLNDQNSEVNLTSVYAFLKVDTYNNAYFPKEGLLLDGHLNIYLKDANNNEDFEPYAILKSKVGTFFTFFKKLSILNTFEIGITFDNPIKNPLYFGIGGYGAKYINNYSQFLGYDFLEISEPNIIKNTSVIDFTFLNSHHINFTLNFANAGVNLFDRGNQFYIPEYSGYALGYGLETPFGPVEIKSSWSPEKQKILFFVSVGFKF